MLAQIKARQWKLSSKGQYCLPWTEADGRPPHWKFRIFQGKSQASLCEMEWALASACKLSLDYRPATSYVASAAAGPRGMIFRSKAGITTPLYIERVTTIILNLVVTHAAADRWTVQASRLSSEILRTMVTTGEVSLRDVEAFLLEGWTDCEKQQTRWVCQGETETEPRGGNTADHRQHPMHCDLVGLRRKGSGFAIINLCSFVFFCVPFGGGRPRFVSNLCSFAFFLCFEGFFLCFLCFFLCFFFGVFFLCSLCFFKDFVVFRPFFCVFLCSFCVSLPRGALTICVFLCSFVSFLWLPPHFSSF